MSILNSTTNIALFENLDNPGHYMMFLCSPETAQKRYEQYTRTGRYDETGKAEPYGYIELNISKPVLKKLPVESEQEGDQFLTYLKDTKVAGYIEIRQAAAWGWFKFSEDVDIDRWFGEYKSYYDKKQQESAKINNSGLQTALF